MNHLIVEQNNTIGNPEVVTSDIIDKVYKTDVNNTLDGTSNVKGYLQCSHAYEDAVAYLTNKYPDLHINVTSGLYIRFKDLNMQNACASRWGDGTGITKAQAATVTEIPSYPTTSTFTSFDELKYFTNVTQIGGWVFNGITTLKSIDLSNITTLGVQCFQNCTALETVNLSSKFTTVTDYYGCFTNCISLKDVGDISNLTQIYYALFQSCNVLPSVNISNKCTIIGDNAFYECFALATLGDVSKITSIGQRGFYHCTSLTDLSFPECLSIGQESFRRGSLTSIAFGKLTTVVGIAQFAQCTNLLHITGLTNVTSVGQEFCVECTNLISVDLGSACKTVGGHAFYNCRSLISVGDLSGVTYFDDNCFDMCTNVVIDLSTASPTYIGYYAFSNTKLTDINLSNVTTIRWGAFLACASYNKVVNAPNLTTLVEDSESCSNQCGAFNRSGITGIENLGTIKYIPIGYPQWDRAQFGNCLNLRYVKLPATLLGIGGLSFINCPVLEYMQCLAVTPPSCGEAILDGNTICKIYVPDDSVSSYKSTSGWSTYASRIYPLSQWSTDFPNG